MKLQVTYENFTVSLIEQGDGSCLVWHKGDHTEVIPLPEDVVFALMSLKDTATSAK